ncbi:hypothetical protein EAN91_00100 [Klebsiella pneumoniae]|nr:hypothetical protein EAN91_00100 [Klebsiella pneumoniae]
MGCWACAAQVHQKTQSKGKIGRAEMALTLINKLYGIERDMEEAGDAQRYQTRQSQSRAFTEQLKARLDKTLPCHVVKVPWASNQLPCEQLVKADPLHRKGTPAHRQQPCRAGEPPSHVHMTKASPVSSRYVMPTHDGVLTVSVRQSIVFPKGA